MSGQDPSESTSYEIEISHLNQSTKAWGALRDKGVLHLNSTGTITLPLNSFRYTIDECGRSVGRRTANGALYPYDEFNHFVEPISIERTTDTIYRTISGIPWYRLPSSVRVFSYDITGYRLIVCERYLGATYRNGNLYASAAWSSQVLKLRRSSTSIYSHGTASKSGTYTPSELQSLVSSIPSSGGTLFTSITDLGRYVLNNQSQALADISFGLRNTLFNTRFHLDEIDTEFGELALDCADQLKFIDQNFLLWICDVDDWKNFRKLWKNFSNSKGWSQAIKAWKTMTKSSGGVTAANLADLFRPGSNTYLFGKYAVLPNVIDVKRLVNAGKAFTNLAGHQRLHSRKVTVLEYPGALSAQHTAVLTVECLTLPERLMGEKAQKMIWELKRRGVYPEVTNLWDILPYSFVLDWFLDIGGLLEDVNEYLDMKWYFPVKYCILSEKIEVGYPIDFIVPGLTQVTGEVQFSYYHRWITGEVPLPPVELPSLGVPGVKHLLEAGALGIQRIRV